LQSRTRGKKYRRPGKRQEKARTPSGSATPLNHEGESAKRHPTQKTSGARVTCKGTLKHLLSGSPRHATGRGKNRADQTRRKKRRRYLTKKENGQGATNRRNFRSAIPGSAAKKGPNVSKSKKEKWDKEPQKGEGLKKRAMPVLGKKEKNMQANPLCKKAPLGETTNEKI